MFGQIDSMRMARELGAHAALRQRVIAANVANADTPGYRAQDLRGFAQTYRDSPAIGLRTTRPDHVSAGDWGSAQGARIDAGGEPAPNGNTVSIEDELVRAAEARREFDLSLSVFQSGMIMLRTAIGRRG
ncbi:FlgB family protein [Paracoccus contaminans]|uniref:Flagellar basal body rod protein FlgB n=1 Tax=Paracoccus contaminans TaxID=1945662 RepID=A0A1W6CX25_9RHOB|nr:FlgB family protein [Paracoccus contaminans]ARJ69375.1 flagellar basal body rod protein FlgB [Paracoccus contaminans]